MDQCVEQQVRSFFVAQSSDPADPKSLFTHAEDAPRGPAVEWRCALLPRVLHDVDPIGGGNVTKQPFSPPEGKKQYPVQKPRRAAPPAAPEGGVFFGPLPNQPPCFKYG